MLIAYIIFHTIIMITPIWSYQLWKKKNPVPHKNTINKQNAKEIFAKFAILEIQKKEYLISIRIAILFEIINFTMLYFIGLF